MEEYRVVNDKNGETLLIAKQTQKDVDAWVFAYNVIKADQTADIFIEVYVDGDFDHWCDSDDIVSAVEYFQKV